ncbi:MAG: aminotransferase class I/II-fold pyridoxal phosphate-dependent enzyme [Proteobacteria bacterium]|nr:aminotransferase class I/II-fold pyridoxal phosphate-dependent enzyme [Pseudomonadota bacterium]
MNPLAQALNEEIERAAPEVHSMLSPYGRRLYFPRGILSQSAEAVEKGYRVNATIGIATEGGGPMHLPSIRRHLVDLDPGDVFSYAPPAGRPGLRELWREKLREENPSLQGVQIGLPVVTSAITHGLTLAGELFVDEGDALLLPDKFWGNYRLLYEVRFGAELVTFPFFAGDAFNSAGLAETLRREGEKREKLVVLLNFPNNPTGYVPTPDAGDAIAASLVEQAERGTRLVVLCDDAYFGLFYHLGRPSMTESLFGLLANRHPNLLAVKLDGATKEMFAWGLRCGFLTVGPGRADTADALCAALDAKLRGAIRAGISNVSQLSQSLVEQALSSSSLSAERKQKREVLQARAEKVYEVANAPRFAESWDVYPFNSGYFMCVRLDGVDAEHLRLHLLDQYGVGLIATSATDLRIAFSCLELEEVEPLFETLHKAIQELRED